MVIKKYRRSHAADWITSPKLQGAWKLLKERGVVGATSLEINHRTGSLNPATTISQLRANGIKIGPAKYIYETMSGSKVYLYRLEGGVK